MRHAVNILFAILKGNHFVHQSLEYQHFQSEVVNIYEVSPFFVKESWRVSGCVLGPEVVLFSRRQFKMKV